MITNKNKVSQRRSLEGAASTFRKEAVPPRATNNNMSYWWLLASLPKLEGGAAELNVAPLSVHYTNVGVSGGCHADDDETRECQTPNISLLWSAKNGASAIKCC